MKKYIFLTVLLTPIACFAQPSSQVAWTAEQLGFVKAGNPQKGKELAQACSACHGGSGISSIAGTPSLAGQSANYVFKQLQDYAAGDRQHEIMSSLAKTLSKQDIADLSSWFASLSRPFQSGMPANYENAEKLVKNGDNQRILPPCEVCHGGRGEGQKMDIPALSGQNADYLAAMLKAFKAGSRHNDIYSRMRLIAQTLTDEEIVELGYFYQNIKN